MSVAPADLTLFQTVVLAQLLTLAAPGANQLTTCCASACCLRAGLSAAAILTGIVTGLASLAVLFGHAIVETGLPVHRLAGIGAPYLTHHDVRRILAAWRNSPLSVRGRHDWLTVAATALSNPISFGFCVTIVIPAVGFRSGSGFATLLVLPMTVIAGLNYASSALAFGSLAVRRVLVGHHGWIDAVAGCCLVPLAIRLLGRMAG